MWHHFQDRRLVQSWTEKEKVRGCLPATCDDAEKRRQYAEYWASTKWRDGKPYVRNVLGQYDEEVTCCSAWGRTAVTGCADRAMHFWDLEDGRSTLTAWLPSTPNALVQLSPESAVVACERKVDLWRAGHCVRSFRVEQDRGNIHAIAVHDTALFSTTPQSGEVRAWDLYSGALVQMWRPGGWSAVHVLHKIDLGSSQVLAAGHASGAITLSDPRVGSLVAELAHSRRDFDLTSAASTPDGTSCMFVGRCSPCAGDFDNLPHLAVYDLRCIGKERSPTRWQRQGMTEEGKPESSWPPMACIPPEGSHMALVSGHRTAWTAVNLLNGQAILHPSRDAGPIACMCAAHGGFLMGGKRAAAFVRFSTL